MIEMAFLGALPVHKIELFHLAFGNSALECNEGDPRLLGRPGRVSRLAKASATKMRDFVFGQFLGRPIGAHDCTLSRRMSSKAAARAIGARLTRASSTSS